MSSFKRRASSTQPPPPSGTRISPGSSSTITTSTGIPSLDDILGGGLPLSCSLLVLAPDTHSAYGELVQKYFISQGLASGHKLCVVDDDARDILAECMWVPGGAPSASTNAAEDEEDDKAAQHDTKIKIAWRYEQMKQFQTTVPTSNQSSEDYCRVFDLTCRIPDTTVQSAIKAGQLARHHGATSCPRLVPSPVDPEPNAYHGHNRKFVTFSSRFVGYCAAIPTPVHPSHYPLACALMHGVGRAGSKSWAGSPTPASLSQHSPRPLLDAARALGLGREQPRVQTLHLDLEGGVGERRTTPSANAIALDDVAPVRSHVYGHADGDQTAAPTARAAVHVEIEQASATTAALSITDVPSERTATGGKKTKVKKKVAFMSDRPDLYDF
ncbi:predicted protein [Postia placenta Mad-698-R]|nr:predicted protein [Postia placenta Mad-698-R]